MLDWLDVVGKVAQILGPLLAGIAAISSILNRRKIQRLEVNVDGRLSQLLEERGKAERAGGKEDERVEQRHREAAAGAAKNAPPVETPKG